MLKRVILLLGLCMALTGCSHNETVNGKASDVASDNVVTGETQAVVDKSELDMDYQETNQFQVIGNTCYYIRHEKDEENNQISVLYCRKVGNGEEEIVHTFNYNREEDESYLAYSRCDTDGSWYNLWKNFEGVEENWSLEKLDVSGTELFRVELSEEWGERLRTEFIQDATVSANGEFCVITEQSALLLWDSQGQEIGMLDGSKAGLSTEPAERVSMIKTKGVISAGTAGLFLYESNSKEQKIIFVPVDVEMVALEKSFVVDVSEVDEEQLNASSFIGDEVGVFGGYEGFCYLSTKDSMWKCTLKDEGADKESAGVASGKLGSTEKLFNWMDPHISVDRTQLVGIGQTEGSLIFLCYDVSLKTVSRMVVENKNVQELADPNVIIIGCVGKGYLENLEKLVQRYNAQSEEYTAEIRVYDRGSYQGMDELTMALLKGEGPDVFDLHGLSMEYYSTKGVLEDLNPYLEDSDIQLLETVERALNMNNKLYALSSSFSIRYFICPKEYCSDGGISVAQCAQMAEDYPDARFSKLASKYLYLFMMTEGDMASYVDIEGRICSFDSEEFISLLEEINNWEESLDAVGSLTVDELYQKEYLVTQRSFSTMSEYLVLKRTFGEFACIAGFPNQEGNARYCMELSNHYAMNSASTKKAGAWDFLQYLLSETAQKKAGAFPITKELFEETIRREQGEHYYQTNPYTGMKETNLDPTEVDIQELYDIVNNMYYFDTTPNAIQSIIGEESVNYFNGTISSKKAAENIQNRVTLYLNEM